MQTRLFIAGALLALSLQVAKAQEVAGPTFGFELGTRNGVYYEHPLGQHFSVGYRWIRRIRSSSSTGLFLSQSLVLVIISRGTRRGQASVPEVMSGS